MFLIADGQRNHAIEFHAIQKEKYAMSVDKNRTEGSARNVKGKAKEAFGKATGDQKTKADGKADQAKGKAQNAVGSAKDKAKGK